MHKHRPLVYHKYLDSVVARVLSRINLKLEKKKIEVKDILFIHFLQGIILHFILNGYWKQNVIYSSPFRESSWRSSGMWP